MASGPAPGQAFHDPGGSGTPSRTRSFGIMEAPQGNAAGPAAAGGNGQFQETGTEHAMTGRAGWLAADQQVINRHVLRTVSL